MAFRFKQGELPSAAVRRIAGEQLEQAVALTADGGAAAGVHAAVHEVRRRCKKVRALLRLVRGSIGDRAWKRENTALRDAARTISVLRDTSAVLEALGRVEKEGGAEGRVLAAARAELEARREEEACRAQGRPAPERIAEVSAALAVVLDRSRTWTVRDEGFEAVADGVVRAYASGRRVFRRDRRSPSLEGRHELRKRAKDHRYHCDLLQVLWPELLLVREKAMHDLTDLLGEEQDLVHLRRALGDGASGTALADGDRAALLAWLDDRALRPVEDVRPVAMRLYAEKPGDLAATWRRWWRAAGMPDESG